MDLHNALENLDNEDDNMDLNRATTTTIGTEQELQLIYQHQTGTYTNIFAYEKNITETDNKSFVDNNEYGGVKFATLSNDDLLISDSSKGPRIPWASFWKKKRNANKALIQAI